MPRGRHSAPEGRPSSSLRLAWSIALVVLALIVPGARPAAGPDTPLVSSGVTPLQSFIAILTSTNNPLDLTIAAGPDRLVVGTNDVVVLSDKAGASVATVGLRSFF